jgi:sulfur carrier protein ThiS
MPADEIGLTSLNGKAAPRDAVLRDGDKLEIFPVIVDG